MLKLTHHQFTRKPVKAALQAQTAVSLKSRYCSKEKISSE